MNVAIVGLLVVVTISAVGGWLLSANQTRETPVKVMLFVGYFWLLAFSQLLLIALSYFGWQHLKV